MSAEGDAARGVHRQLARQPALAHRTAFGSTPEVKAALHVARCWRYVDETAIRRAFGLADDIAKLCRRLTR